MGPLLPPNPHIIPWNEMILFKLLYIITPLSPSFCRGVLRTVDKYNSLMRLINYATNIYRVTKILWKIIQNHITWWSRKLPFNSQENEYCLLQIESFISIIIYLFNSIPFDITNMYMDGRKSNIWIFYFESSHLLRQRHKAQPLFPLAAIKRK